jgi:hypothetical protein
VVGEQSEVQAVTDYPDISEIIARKRRHRRRLAALPFEQKIEMVFKLKGRREFLQSARAAGTRRAAAARTSGKVTHDPRGER